MSILSFDHVTFTWPDGTAAVDDISAEFGDCRTGLVGRNGSGKSTLVRLATGELTPSSGHVQANADVACLPQQFSLQPDRSVADLLGVATPLAALRAIDAGDGEPSHFEAVSGHWDVEARAYEALADAGLGSDVLDRTVGTLSCGEAVLVAIAGIRLRNPKITVLDEPTNNLDIDARTRLYSLVRAWRGALIIVSHDVELLDLMDETAELYHNRLTVFGGPYWQWRAWLDAEQNAAVQAERDAQKAWRNEKRQRIDAEVKLARRQRYAKTDYANKRRPRMVMKQLSRDAQESAGKLRGQMSDAEESARQGVDAAQRRVRDDAILHMDVPDPHISPARRILTLTSTPPTADPPAADSGALEAQPLERSWTVQGRERIALTGPNGAGKTLLLRRLLGESGCWSAPPDAVTGQLHVPHIGYLPQGVDGLDEDDSVLANIGPAAPTVSDGELRNRLARFWIRGAMVERPVHSLSGGERFRVALARLLLADPPPQLLVLDEPTNNLDLSTAEQLLTALHSYRGAVLLVSHDHTFIARYEPDVVLELRDGRLSQKAI